MIIAFIINAFRHRIRDAGDAVLATGIRILTELPGGAATIPERARALDAIRVARERIQSTFDPTGRVVAILIDADRPDAAEPAVNLALAFAETGLPTRLVLPFASPSLAAQARSVVGYPLELVLADDSAHAPTSHTMTDTIRELVASAPTDAVTIVVLPATSDLSSRVAAARLADALILVITLDKSRKDRVESGLGDLLEVGGSLLGAIVVPKSRRLVPATANASVDVAPVEPTAPLAPPMAEVPVTAEPIDDGAAETPVGQLISAEPPTPVMPKSPARKPRPRATAASTPELLFDEGSGVATAQRAPRVGPAAPRQSAAARRAAAAHEAAMTAERQDPRGGDQPDDGH